MFRCWLVNFTPDASSLMMPAITVAHSGWDESVLPTLLQASSIWAVTTLSQLHDMLNHLAVVVSHCILQQYGLAPSPAWHRSPWPDRLQPCTHTLPSQVMGCPMTTAVLPCDCGPRGPGLIHTSSCTGVYSMPFTCAIAPNVRLQQ